MQVDLGIAKQIKMQYNSFMYPLGYENRNQPDFKYFIYTPGGGFETLLNQLAWFMFYACIALSLFAIFIIFYELCKSN
jgi:hypothetical protein